MGLNGSALVCCGRWLVGGVEGGEDSGGDAAAVGSLVAVVAGPFADGCVRSWAGRRGTSGAEGGWGRGLGSESAPAGAKGSGAAACPAGVVDPGREVSARRGGVLSGQVDRIGNAVEGEGDRLFRGLVPVEIVEVVHGRRLCHGREVSPAFRAIDGGFRLMIISRRRRNCTGDGTSEGSEDVPVFPVQPATATRGHRRGTVARGRSSFARVAAVGLALPPNQRTGRETS